MFKIKYQLKAALTEFFKNIIYNPQISWDKL